MGNSLQDQLLKAGVVNKQQAQKANSKKRKQRHQQHKGATTSADNVKQQARQAQAEKTQRDRELNRQKQQQTEQKAVASQVQQLIKDNQLSLEDGDMAYNFVVDNKVRKIHVPDEIHAQLGRGQAFIVRFKKGFSVIPAAVADKVSARDSSLVIRNQAQETTVDENDPYADYQVPDDLIW